MAERVQVRTITNAEGNQLLRILRRSSGSVVTWRRAQMILLSARAFPRHATIAWQFTNGQARVKLKKLYPVVKAHLDRALGFARLLFPSLHVDADHE